jgi:alpha-tubulin suppressor-like RCC1 family protein
MRPLVLVLSLAACSSSPSASPDGGGGDDAPGSTVLPSATATQLAVGRLHICALTSAGAVRCWGTSQRGEVGNGGALDSTNYLVPVQVVGLTSGVTAIAAHNGDHTCALAGGAVTCWGDDTYGQLGSGIPHSSTGRTDSSTPIAVAGLGAGVQAIAVGGDHSCAITAAGGVKCWGNNEYGQLGNDSDVATNLAVDVMGIASGATAIAAGHRHTCAIVSGGLRCWGSNVDGELGNNSTDTSRTPVAVMGLASGVTQVTAGRFTTCAIANGAAKCWGNNDAGQVGNGVSSGVGGGGDDPHVPAQVMGLTSGVTQISTADQLTCAVVSGATRCWGANGYGNLGNNSEGAFESFVPVGVTGLTSGGREVGTASHHGCALTTAGAVSCWGEAEGGGGPLGNGTNDSSKVPVPVKSLP